MKNICRFLLFFIFLQTTAQTPWEPYLDQLAEASTNSLKLKALDSIVKLSFRKDTDVFIPYSKQYIDLALANDRFEDAAKKAMNLSFPINSVNRPLEGIAYIDKVLAYKEKIKDSFLYAGLYLKRGGGYFRIDHQKAVDDYTIAINHFGAGDSLYLGDAYLFRGQSNVNLGEFIKGMDDYEMASIIFRDLKDYQYMQHASQGRITVFSMNGFYQEAKDLRIEYIQNLKELNLPEYISTEHYNQAIDDRKNGLDGLAYESLIEAEKYLEFIQGHSQIYFAVHSLLSTYYAENGNLKKSEEHLKLIEDKRAGNDTDLMLESHYNSAKSGFLYYSGRASEALPYAQKKLENAKKLGFEEEESHALLDLSKIYEAMGNDALGIKYYKSHTQKKDSLFNQAKTNSLLYYQTLYETEKQAHEIESQDASIALLEKDNENFKKMLIFLGICTLLLLGVIYLIKDRKNLKNTKLLQQKFSQELLANQENERKRISKELHDGLGQQLLLIKNNLVLNNNPSGKEMMDIAIDEVRSISRDLHPFQLEELGLTKAIEHMIAQIDENSSLFISCEVDNIDHLFTKEKEVNIYRIVQESFNNIIKHSGAEASKLSIQKNNDAIEITIRDNGRGFTWSEKYKDLKSLGLKTLKERTRFLKGVMKIDSKENRGTVLEFNVPIG